MNTLMRKITLPLAIVILAAGSLQAQITRTNTPLEIFGATLLKIADIIEPDSNAAPQTVTVTLKADKADGAPRELADRTATVAWQAPDKLRLSVVVGEETYSLGRNGQEMWIHAAQGKFGVVGKPGVPRFASNPASKDNTRLPPFKLPIPRQQILMAPLLFQYQALPAETNDGVHCAVISATPLPQAVQGLKIPEGTISLAVRETDSLPAWIEWSDGRQLKVRVRFQQWQMQPPLLDARWQIPASAGDKIDTTAVSHLKRFISVALSALNERIPSLPEKTTGQRRVVATAGEGRLEEMDGTYILFLKGTPEEMGRQHGTLMRKQVRHLVDRILYGVGVGSSFAKKRWFFGEIEEAQARLQPHIDPRYLQEMDALAQAAGLEKEEVRLANFFPELFHCSGFALFGEATEGGRMFHGRILDYLKGVGLEQNAVVMVFQPEKGNAWVNIGYAGFVGSVTAMNEKHVAIGEMGGRGEGHWDGKPMAQLMREVMERANTIDEALDIMRRGPRTCEYYYVISDAKTKRAAGIAATPDKFETIWPGQAHPQLPHAIKDAVLMSAGDRYEKLVERVKAKYGHIDSSAARELMTRPVCMKSNIHSVLFEPDTLDFWVANADGKNVASHTRYTRYNLGELLKGPPSQ